MADEQFKRNIAFKLRIGDLLMGKPVNNGERFGFLELGDKKVVRINIAGNIVDKYESQGETKYLNLTIDDGSGQIRLKSFGENVEKFKSIIQGQTVIVIGTVRSWNNEIYISPEIIKEQDPKYLLIRKLETEKEISKGYKGIEKEKIIAIKDSLLELIKNSETDGGVEKDKIIMNFNEVSPAIVNQELQKLLEEGIIFEPRPGKVRYLG